MPAAPAATPAPIPCPSRGLGSRAAGWWPLLPVLVAVTLLGLPTLAYPFGPDQAIFATIGRTINQGGFPYVDAWDQKPPGIYLLYAVAQWLPGPLVTQVRLFDLVWTLATIIALFGVARQFWGTRAATFASLLYGAVYFTGQGWWYLAQPDGWTGLPLLLAILLYLGSRDRRWEWLGCATGGVLIGLALQLRFTAAPVVPVLALVETAQQRGPWWPWLRRMLWMAGGLAVSQGALVLYLAAGDALLPYLEATQFAAGYTRLGWPFAPNDRTLWHFLAHVRGAFLLFVLSAIALTAPAMAAMFRCLVLRPDQRAQQVTAMALVAYLGILAQQKFFWYHWQLLLPFMALLAGCGWDAMFGRVEVRLGSTRVAGAAKAVLVTGAVLATPALTDYGYAQWDDFLHRNDGVLSRVRYDNNFGGYAEGTFSYLADVQVAAYVREHTAEADTIYIFGYDPLVYLLSDRTSASRFIYSLPLMSHWAPPRWRDDFYAEIDKHRPVYFITQRNEGAARWITGQDLDTEAWAWKLSPLAARLEREYELEIVIEDFTLYRRRDR